MATNLSSYFPRTPLALGLRPGDVVRRMGYKSIAGTANKIIRFEETGDVLADLFTKLAIALGIGQPTIDGLVEEDRRKYLQEWNAWANEPVEPKIIFRAIPGVFLGHPIPEDLKTPEEMEQYAADFAKRTHAKTWLVLSRRLRIYFTEDGTKREVQEAAPGQTKRAVDATGWEQKKVPVLRGFGYFSPSTNLRGGDRANETARPQGEQSFQERPTMNSQVRS